MALSPQEQPTYTIEDIGRRIRERNPDTFKGLNYTDAAIGQRAVERKPELKSLIRSGGSPVTAPSTPTATTATTPATTGINQEGLLSGFLQHPLSSIGNGLKDAAVGLVKPIAQTPIQLGRAAIAGIGGLTGRPDIQSYYSQPVNVPILGQVKGLSAVPGDAQRYGTQTPGETIAQAAEMGASVIGAGGVKTAAEQGTKALLKEGLLTGAKTGAKSGGLLGYASGMKDPSHSIGDVAMSTAGGALGGAALGGLLGGSTALAGRVFTKAGRTAAAEGKALDIVSPKITQKVKEQALKEGRVTPSGLLSRERILPSSFEKDVARTASKYVKPGATSQKNIESLKSAISSISENDIKPFLKKNNASFTPAEIEERLSKVELPDLFKGDTSINNALGLAKKRMMDKIAKNDNTLEGLWEARKAFDQEAEKQFPRIFGSDSSSALNNAIKEMRMAVNDFVGEKSKNAGGELFKGKLQRLNHLYEAIDNISEKGASDVGTTGLQKLGKKYPLLKEGIKYAGGSALLAGGYEAVNK